VIVFAEPGEDRTGVGNTAEDFVCEGCGGSDLRCQSASERDPGSACNRDPSDRGLSVAGRTIPGVHGRAPFRERVRLARAGERTVREGPVDPRGTVQRLWGGGVVIEPRYVGPILE
jgi:hypothetical protein